MALQPTTPMPQLNVGFKNSELKEVGPGFADAYYDAKMAQYNNEYNYWLWQQQAEYNSPAAQMARAKEAGLNPNVVAGNVSSGNLGSIPSSNGKLSGNVEGNKINLANTAINSFNALLKAVGEGVNATSQISGIPDDIATYRYLINENQQAGVQGKLVDNILKNIENARYAYLGGASSDELGYLGLPEFLLEFIGNEDNQHLFKFKDSALTKMWDELASEPGIANILKNSALSKNEQDVLTQKSVQLLNEAKARMTDKEYSMFEAKFVSGLVLKALGIANPYK